MLTETPLRPTDVDVTIIGGGPVGLLLANLLGKAGRSVVVFESSLQPPARSMAIGITPPSLDIFAQLNLDQSFIDQGLAITTAVVHEQGKRIGSINFRELHDPFHFILSLPQSDTSRILREHLGHFPSVQLRSGWKVDKVEQDQDQVRVYAIPPGGDSFQITTSAFAAGCDGARGEVCRWLGIQKATRTYAPRFLMADFDDASGLGSQAHLFFHTERPVESFPLPGGKRRWIIRHGWDHRIDLHEPMEAAIARLTGINLKEEDKRDESWFQPRHQLARHFARGRVALCGDAAHVMSPIGGQGLNTGFGDAAFLARAYENLLDGHGSISDWMKVYQRRRKRVFRRAATRSALGMRLGVMTGSTASALRSLFVRRLLEREPSRTFVLRWFTMRSLPHPLEIP